MDTIGGGSYHDPKNITYTLNRYVKDMLDFVEEGDRALSIGNTTGISGGINDDYGVFEHEKEHSQFQDVLGPVYLPIHIINQGFHSLFNTGGIECYPFMPQNNGGVYGEDGYGCGN